MYRCRHRRSHRSHRAASLGPRHRRKPWPGAGLRAGPRGGRLGRALPRPGRRRAGRGVRRGRGVGSWRPPCRDEARLRCHGFGGGDGGLRARGGCPTPRRFASAARQQRRHQHARARLVAAAQRCGRREAGLHKLPLRRAADAGALAAARRRRRGLRALPLRHPLRVLGRLADPRGFRQRLRGNEGGAEPSSSCPSRGGGGGGGGGGGEWRRGGAPSGRVGRDARVRGGGRQHAAVDGGDDGGKFSGRCGEGASFNMRVVGEHGCVAVEAWDWWTCLARARVCVCWCARDVLVPMHGEE